MWVFVRLKICLALGKYDVEKKFKNDFILNSDGRKRKCKEKSINTMLSSYKVLRKEKIFK